MSMEEITPSQEVSTPTDEPIALDIEGAVDALADLPDDELGFDADPLGEVSTPPSQEEEAEAAVEETEPESEEDASDEDAETKDNPEDAELFEVTLPGGDKAELTLEELGKGYSRETDYVQKTQALSTERNEFREAASTAVADLAKQREQVAEAMEFWLSQNPVGERPDRSMLEPNSPNYDPDKWHLLNAEFDERSTIEQNARQQREIADRDRQVMEEKRFVAYQEDQKNQLLKAWPEWADEARVPELSKEVGGILEGYGFNPDEIGNIFDHRVYLLARDAAKSKKLNENAPKIRRKLAAKPKPTRGGARVAKGGSNTALSENLRKTGSVDSAAKLFENYI